MRQRVLIRFVLGLALFGVGAAPTARAAAQSVVSPGNCTVPTHVVSSPDGAFATTVVVRDISGNPIASIAVDIVFFSCYPFRPCPTPCTDCSVDTIAKSVRAFTAANGEATFDLRVGGGSCGDFASVRVYADGLLLGSVPFAPLDEDGDQSVTSADVAFVQGYVGRPQTREDFDGDGIVTSNDVAIVQAHLGATCAATTPVVAPSWGRLKTLYR